MPLRFPLWCARETTRTLNAFRLRLQGRCVGSTHFVRHFRSRVAKHLIIAETAGFRAQEAVAPLLIRRKIRCPSDHSKISVPGCILALPRRIARCGLGDLRVRAAAPTTLPTKLDGGPRHVWWPRSITTSHGSNASRAANIRSNAPSGARVAIPARTPLPFAPLRALLSAFRQDVVDDAVRGLPLTRRRVRVSANPVGPCGHLYGIDYDAARAQSDSICHRTATRQFLADTRSRLGQVGAFTSRRVLPAAFRFEEAQIVASRCDERWRNSWPLNGAQR